MKLKLKITGVLLGILSLGSVQEAKSQYFYSGKEYGFAAGGAQYFGDLNENYGFKYIQPSGAAFIRFHLNPYIGLRTQLAYAKVGYDDKFSNNYYQQKRNLNFKSDILEFSLMAEFNFVRFATGESDSRFTPYLGLGVGAFYYAPYTTYQGKRYYLRKQGTEGQNLSGYEDRKYGPVSMCFPIGAGIKWWIRPGLNLGFEIADRFTLTDYLDDVSTTYVGANNFGSATKPDLRPVSYYLQDRSAELSPNDPLGRADKQRGNSATKDQYLTFMISLSFQLKVYRCPNYMSNDFRSH